MKKLTCIFIALVILTACKKNDQLPGNNGCITQIKRQNFNIKSSDSIAAIQLLKQNNIPYNNVQLEYFSSNIVPSNQSNAGDAYASVFVIQQINGLPILSGELWYQFTNSVLQTTSGTRYNEINLSNSSSLQLAQLRAAYIAEVAKNNSTLSTQLRDSCLVAQFGYYDLNVNVKNTPSFVKAWLVKPQHSQYPQVTLQDGSGKTINYNSGIILF